MNVQDWSSIPAEKVADGITRQMVVGDKLMVCRLQLAAHVITNPHTHPHEQITMVERGRVKYIIGGIERIVSAGDVLHFPPHVEHGATMLDEDVVLIDIFSPPREDFLGRKA